jgi:hypothetical protein
MKRANTSVLLGTRCAAVAASVAVALSAIVLVPTSAWATPAFSAQTGQPCGTCHVNKAGGGALTDAGAKFKANGNKMK